MKEIPITIAPGELYDRFNILCLKEDKIKDPEKLKVITAEADQLERYVVFLNTSAIRQGFGVKLTELDEELYAVNKRLWDIEDALRIREKDQRFDEDFIELARSVYKTNDRRAALKRQISDLFGAEIYEVKEHAEY